MKPTNDNSKRKGEMAILLNRNGWIHIQWYDPMLRKIRSKATKLRWSPANVAIAKKITKKIQEAVTKNWIEIQQLGITRMTISRAFEHFLQINQDKNIKTIKDYKRFFKVFIQFFDEEAPCTTVTKLAVEDWFLTIRKLPLSQNSIHAYGKQCIHFLNFLFEYNYTPYFRVNRSVKTRPEVKEKIVFTDADIKKIFEGLKGKNSNFRAAIYLLFYTGLRSSDVLNITKDKIDINNRSLSYYSPKRKKFRSVSFHETLVPILEARLQEVTEGPVLEYKSVENLGKAVTRYFKSIDLSNAGYTARTFRKTFITLCRSRFNMDASIVRELVGHEHENTADKYYNLITLQAMRKELRKFKYIIR
jgi:integrase